MIFREIFVIVSCRTGKHPRQWFDSGGSGYSRAVCLLPLGLFPPRAVAQTTEPLLRRGRRPVARKRLLRQDSRSCPAKTVTQRRAERGLRAGDFLWFPRAEVDEAFNDNKVAQPAALIGIGAARIAIDCQRPGTIIAVGFWLINALAADREGAIDLVSKVLRCDKKEL